MTGLARRCFSRARSTIQRITPPTKMASVVAMERYAPTANVSERTPSSSTTMTSATPSSTSVHGSLRERMPLMTVAIRRPCGAAAFSLPMPWIHWTSICAGGGVVEVLAVLERVRADGVEQDVLARCR